MPNPGNPELGGSGSALPAAVKENPSKQKA
jgi:hypothetical protein